MLGHTSLPSSEGTAPSRLCATSQMVQSVLVMRKDLLALQRRLHALLKREPMHARAPCFVGLKGIVEASP